MLIYSETLVFYINSPLQIFKMVTIRRPDFVIKGIHFVFIFSRMPVNFNNFFLLK